MRVNSVAELSCAKHGAPNEQQRTLVTFLNTIWFLGAAKVPAWAPRTVRILFSIALCWSGNGLADAPPDRLQKSSPVRLSRTHDGHEASLTFYEPQRLLNLSVKALDKSAPVAPMKQRIELWKPLIEDFFRDHGRRKEYLLGIGEYPELGTRIALAAVKSGKWNLRTGKPETGSSESAVHHLLADQSLFEELENLWATFGYKVSVRSVEKILIRRWREITPPGPKAPRVAQDARVPFGWAVLFHLESKRKEP